jgi:hypothetical protein
MKDTNPNATLLGSKRGQLVPPIEDGESFMYLSKQFNFEMDCTETKIEILDKIQYYLKKIDLIPINPFPRFVWFNVMSTQSSSGVFQSTRLDGYILIWTL